MSLSSCLRRAAALVPLLLVVPFAFASAQEPEVSATYRKTVQKLLEVVNAGGVGDQVAYAVAQETLAAIAATGFAVTEEVQQVVVDEALAEFRDQFSDVSYLTDIYAPLYAQHLNEKEIAQLLDFYESPLGQKTLTALPVIATTAAATIQQRGFERIPEFQQKVDVKLREKGIVIAP